MLIVTIHGSGVAGHMALAARYFLPCFVGRGKVPVRAHSRSDKYAAVLRLQNTQPKDRRIYTVLTGILAEQQPWQSIGTQRTGEGKESPGGPESTYAGLQSIFFRGSV